METQEQKKPDLKTELPHKKTSFPVLSSGASQPIPSDDPLGMEGVEHWGWAGAFGAAVPAIIHYRRDSAGGGMRDDSAGRNIRQLCGDIFPAQKRLTSEECRRAGIMS